MPAMEPMGTQMVPARSVRGLIDRFDKRSEMDLAKHFYSFIFLASFSFRTLTHFEYHKAMLKAGCFPYTFFPKYTLDL